VGIKFLTVAVRRESTHSLTEFILRAHPISRGPIDFLSDATNDVILASRRRIQFTDTGNTSDPHRCKISPGADWPRKSHGMTLPHGGSRVKSLFLTEGMLRSPPQFFSGAPLARSAANGAHDSKCFVQLFWKNSGLSLKQTLFRITPIHSAASSIVRSVEKLQAAGRKKWESYELASETILTPAEPGILGQPIQTITGRFEEPGFPQAILIARRSPCVGALGD